GGAEAQVAQNEHYKHKAMAWLGFRENPVNRCSPGTRAGDRAPARVQSTCAEDTPFCADRTLRLRIRRSRELGCNPKAFAASLLLPLVCWRACWINCFLKSLSAA